MMPSVSVGVCAFNEERNIQRTLDALSQQRLEGFELLEVLVISSGSTDRTDELVLGLARKDPRIKLIRQERREGKVSAVNAFMRSAAGDLLVLNNADNVLEEGSLQHLIEPFIDPKVGIVGGRPVPVNERSTLVGFAVHMLWDMHHRLSLTSPKIGELVAFRNEHLQLPTDLQLDEDLIRMMLERKGYHAVYAPQAVVLNKGPTTIRDFMKQRTRINIGERYMKRRLDYDIPTQDASLVIAAFAGFLKDNLRHPLKMAGAIAMEVSARVYALVYVALDRGDQIVWSQVGTTKDLRKE